MKRILLILLIVSMACLLLAQTTTIVIISGEKLTIAVPDFRGTGAAQQQMGVFNQALYNELNNSGQLKILPKTTYPLTVPQQPSDFHEHSAGQSSGLWLSDWSSSPVNAKYMAFGYAADRGNQLVLFGWLFDVAQPAVSSAQVLGKIYFGTLDAAGARKVAQEFAADILKLFGGVSLAGTKIYFVSDRTAHKEIWSMDYDGSNQTQFTRYNSLTNFPVVSADNSKIAFTTWSTGVPQIFLHSLATGRKLTFYNQQASVNSASDFTPDSKSLLFYSTTATPGYSQIYQSDDSGGHLRRISQAPRAIEVEAKANPKTGADLIFVSDRGGLPQIYRMNIDGTDVTRLTNGEGEAVNPCWHPDGQHIAFAWTRGYAPGGYNIFIMDVATRQYNQLTSGEGRNENPSWAPDGVHIVYSSKRGRSSQIWTMRADGTDKHPLTNAGSNEKPVWSKASQ